MHRRAAILALIASLYLALSLSLPPQVFWSPDEGSKFLQMTAFSWNHGLEAEVVYPGRLLDPMYDFYPRRLAREHPFHEISLTYPQPRPGGGVDFNWSSAFPLLSRPFYQLMGLRGLTVIPWLAALATAALAGSIARRVGAREGICQAATIITAFASPVLFYGLVFWEHTAAVASGLGALALVLRPPDRRRDGLAVILLVIAVLLRHEMVLFGSALIAATAWARRPWVTAGPAPSPRRRRRLALALAIVVLVLALGHGSPELGVLIDSMTATERMLAGTMLDLFGSRHFWSRIDERLIAIFVGAPLPGTPPLPRPLAAAAAGGIALAAAAAVCRGRWRLRLALVGLLPILAALAWTVSSPIRFRVVHALFLPVPLMLLSVPYALRGLRDPVANRRLLATTTLATLGLGTVASLPLLFGGMEWGNRYLLVLYPLGIVGALLFVEELGSGDGQGYRHLLLGLMVAAVTLGALFELRGWRELRSAKGDLLQYREELAKSGALTVTDLYWLPSSLATTFVEQPMFAVAEPARLADWLRLRGGAVERFRVVTRAPSLEELEPWIAAARTRDLALFADTTVAGLRFLSFAPVTGPTAEEFRSLVRTP